MLASAMAGWWSRWSLMTWAMRIGAVRATGASCMAALLAQSPCSGLAGFSRPMDGSSTSNGMAKLPSVTARSRASAMALISSARRLMGHRV